MTKISRTEAIRLAKANRARIESQLHAEVERDAAMLTVEEKNKMKEEIKIQGEVLVQWRQLLNQLLEWTNTYGKDLCPPSRCADTYGEGMKEAKEWVRKMIHNGMKV